MFQRANPVNAAQELQITQEKLQNNVILLKISGSIDAHTFEHLENSIQAVFEKEIHRLILDMQGVKYISSSGTGVLVSALAQAREHNGVIVLLNLSKGVQDVLNILDVTQLFVITADRAAAQRFALGEAPPAKSAPPPIPTPAKAINVARRKFEN